MAKDKAVERHRLALQKIVEIAESENTHHLVHYLQDIAGAALDGGEDWERLKAKWEGQRYCPHCHYIGVLKEFEDSPVPGQSYCPKCGVSG